ncbi:hypothetical protein BRD00_05205 [Halobacteriales archaeon QS_8_69_26]|nr:MAG: hypothetical protein BRD00_05205 [Halobacteriales archaeon QS_8_69_26]
MRRERVSTGTEWESKAGYSRAVRAGSRVSVAGTTATDEDGDLVGVGDPYAQARKAIDNVVDALSATGATPADVVRTRIYVTDADDWPAIGRAHAETFGDHPPAATLVEVNAMVDPEMLVEVEAEAVVDD